ncbi:hypothetical protein ALC62_15003 [Cyphomyrmex costatus]|uniref:Uncharacterized protein n=1 Tax=Cyphomyrmex costatus TaxID=456900 RepID=A0A151I875_9HYME|nr:hypothetical protein ALC62_15003 [Cyphomyrmex costatus]
MPYNQSKWFFLKELKACLRELSVIDDTLEALGVPKKYRMLHNWILRIIIGWIAIFLINFALNIFHKLITFKMLLPLFTFIQFLLTLSPVNASHVIIISALICGTVLGYTSSRFHRVSERLQVLYSDLFENYNCRRQNRFILVRQPIVRAKYHKQYVWILM